MDLIACKQYETNLKTAYEMKQIDLSQFESKIFSQNGEDGITEAIFSMIGETNKYYVEFGGGIEFDNTRFLKEFHGWTGLLMNGDFPEKDPSRLQLLKDLSLNLQKEFITAENINNLFQKYNVPHEFDLLSIDIDYNDWHVWKAIQYRPRVVIVETNPNWFEDRVVQYSADKMWDGTKYFGATPLAFLKLGQYKGYTMVSHYLFNAFFIRNDCLNDIDFIGANDLSILFPSTFNNHSPDRHNRSFTSADELLKN